MVEIKAVLEGRGFRPNYLGNSKYEPGVLVHLDKPYGTPSTHIFESKYTILIGAGIGITPFASILKSMLYRSQHGSSGMRLQKVHFY